MPSRPRDTQETKFKFALSNITWPGDLGEQRYISTVGWLKGRITKKAFRSKYPVWRTIHVTEDQTHHHCLPVGGVARGRIVTLRTRWGYDALHRLAHVLQPDDSAWHGPEFVRIFLDLVGWVGGAPVKKMVTAEMIKEGVKTRTWGANAKSSAKARAEIDPPNFSTKRRAIQLEESKEGTLDILRELMRDLET